MTEPLAVAGIAVWLAGVFVFGYVAWDTSAGRVAPPAATATVPRAVARRPPATSRGGPRRRVACHHRPTQRSDDGRGWLSGLRATGRGGKVQDA
jgi:hypothetical protein